MPKDSRQWYSVKDEAESVEIAIYGDIGESWWGESVSAKELLDAIAQAKGKPITLCINSGGGSVFDAFAMMGALRAHDAKVTARVDGVAASAASFLLAAADEVSMSSEAWIMIHDAAGRCFGRAEDMRETADWMDRVNAQLAGIYAKRSGRSQEEFAEAMKKTTWYTADEALEHGLVDSVAEAVHVAACATQDKATIDSAPEGAPIATVGTVEASRIQFANCFYRTVGDTSSTISGNDGGAGPEATPPIAQERFVVIDSKLYRQEGAENA